ncbi:MAG: hypothetical protein V2A79_00230 [Planctomycetota bacterium]
MAKWRLQRRAPPKPRLRVSMILQWADAYHRRTGKWPVVLSGEVQEGWGETWSGVSQALLNGARGLPGGSSLARLLAERRGVRNKGALPRLTERQILRWADAQHARTGTWPVAGCGRVMDDPAEKWANIDAALIAGSRGLPGGDSLARLLERHRGVRNRLHLPRLSKRQILAWADTHHARTGTWPTPKSGPIIDVPGETWSGVHTALRTGYRGLPGGDTLPRFLARHRRGRRLGSKAASSRPGTTRLQQRHVRRPRSVSRLTEDQILAWADAYHARFGRWPTRTSGKILGTRGETWRRVSAALQDGRQGLEGGSSLARLLERCRDYVSPARRPRLTVKKILAWADVYRRRFRRWPTHTSGPVDATSGETWGGIESALVLGLRGLRGGSSLARLLERSRGYRNPAHLPRLTAEQILAWADAYHGRTGEWPTQNAGGIKEAREETWLGVTDALARGRRGLPGGSSLARLLAEHRGHRNAKGLPKLTLPQILTWADAHHRRTGKWPGQKSGPVDGAPGEKWRNIENSLHRGQRELPAGLSITQLLMRYRRTVRGLAGS